MSAPYVKTLRYWFDVEALMYPDIPKPGKRTSVVIRYAETLPWSRPLTTAPMPMPAQAQAQAQDDHTFFAYFGLVEKSVLESELVELFRVTPQGESLSGNHLRASSGNTFLCAIEIAADGQPVTDSLQLAAFAVAFAERKNGSRIGYSAILAALQQRVQVLTADAPAGVVDANWFEQVTGFLVEELGWQPRQLLARAQLCVHTVSLLDGKGKKLSKAPEMEPINSFYLDDLERICLAAETGPGARQIAHYLDGHQNISERLDVSRFDAVNAALAARRFPVGRWPTKFPLFLMQQVAVNTALETLADGGIFSVNGPPGTGKTTLLMDVIAARIVERATVLAQWDHPEQAFSRSPTLVSYPANAGGAAMQGPCYFVDEQLLDCGIVVASANNKAVENITLDLPNLDKVFPQPLMAGGSAFNYFAATAQSILNPESDKPGSDGNNGGKRARSQDAAAPGDDDAEDALAGQVHAQLRCWGLVSVPLGNKTNRRRVARQLGRFGPFGLAAELAKMPAAELDWSRARTRFNAAVARVVDIQEAISEHEHVLALLASAHGRRSDSQAGEAMASRRHRFAETALTAIEELADNAAGALARHVRQRELPERKWPWWRRLIERLFRGANFDQFEAPQQALLHDDDALRTERASHQRARGDAVTKARATSAALGVAHAALDACEREVAHLEQRRLALSAALGTAAFDAAAFAQLSLEEQQKSLPRSNAAHHAARADVFVAAMHLHKAFLKNAGKPFETNFRLALAMLGQDAYLQPHLPEMAPHLWATFFLAIPVVSSTFASISRCFCDLGEGQIGLLLVDEAGQAVPSHALGALWRSKRALIVGDPLQVEPVIKMNRQLDLGMLSYHGAPPEHQLSAYSAQHLADRGNRYGANLVGHDGSDLWVGAPLRVHMRCADPMFSLSNNIAYNNTMVFGPPRADEIIATLARPLLGVSQWHDFSAGDFDEHFSAAEGEAAIRMVVAYAQHGWVDPADGLPAMFLISPFKSVAQGLSNALRNCQDAWARKVDEERVAAWLKGHVGTVHTFQGKECETVIFILGGKTPGARSWAGKRPNIINVAVTRAKRRLYVIGNRRDWSHTVFGKQLADAMPVLAPEKKPERAAPRATARPDMDGRAPCEPGKIRPIASSHTLP
ncbi:MAG: hypothetical protein H7335_21480 [Massilia sp.]|nr:hypothetical protein [Massilia sp.]